MICIERLCFRVGNFALRDVSLSVDEGEYFVLLGPSGAGKTLLLECLCGLNRIESGRILLGGADVTGWEPRRRQIGYLPQDYALFPHRTVRENVGFGLTRPREDRASTACRVDKLLEMTGIAHLAQRYPHHLSGGERQRVALARALAIEPQALLLDEPVSALDEQTRDALCQQLRRLQQTTHTTTLHVCHNFAEMLAVADRVGIIYSGEVLQVGTPREVLERPRNRLVAQFVQAGNLLSAEARADGPWLRLTCPGGLEFLARRPARAEARAAVSFIVRPENFQLLADRSQAEQLPPGSTLVEGTVAQLVDSGPLVQVTVTSTPGISLVASVGKREYGHVRCKAGDRVHLAVASDDVHLLED